MRVRKTENSCKHKPDSKTILYCLMTEVQWLSLLKDKPYQKLIDHIKTLTEIEKDSSSPPVTIKEIAEAINDKRVAKWLPQIVQDLIELNWDHPELFKKEGHNLLYDLYFVDPYGNEHLNFSLWLQQPLQPYDNFDWHFIKTKLSMTNYWVQQISHSFTNGKQSTFVKLINGFPNKYQDQLVEKAHFEGDLSFYKSIRMSYSELEKEIKKIYKIIEC